MKKVFIINGSGGVGKDTFVEMVSEEIPVVNKLSVDEVKKYAKEMGWDGKKTEKDRKFLSDLKRLLVEYNDLPFQSMKRTVENFGRRNEKDAFLFLHIREPEEIKRAVEEFGAQSILVVNKNVESISSNDSDARVSEFKYDYTIDNSGTLTDLKKAAHSFISVVRFMANARRYPK